MATCGTITFNISGTLYEISRSLLEQFPNSMLAKCASEQWQKDPPESQIFIERNGVRFQYVLDYMRDGRVDVPVSQTKQSILEELEYFGIDVEDECLVDNAKAFVETGFYQIRSIFGPSVEALEQCLDTEIRERKLALMVLQQLQQQPCMKVFRCASTGLFLDLFHQPNEYNPNYFNPSIVDGANAILKKVGLRIRVIDTTFGRVKIKYIRGKEMSSSLSTSGT